MNITLTSQDNSQVFIIPVVPPNLPIKSGSNNETFSSIDKDITIIGNPVLREFSLNSFFPVNKNYPFVKNGYEPDGWKYVSFIESAKNSKQPVRVVVTTNNKYTVLNILMSIESFIFSADKVGDIQYELSLKEFNNI